jgi:hypothetical protein
LIQKIEHSSETFCKNIVTKNIIKNTTKDIWKKEGRHEEYKKYTFEILIRHSIFHNSFNMWWMDELWIENEDLLKE